MGVSQRRKKTVANDKLIKEGLYEFALLSALVLNTFCLSVSTLRHLCSVKSVWI